MYPSLVLVQPRKTRPCITERLLMGRKESNQTNKQNDLVDLYLVCSNYAPGAKIGPTPGVTRDMASFQQTPIF